MPIITVAYNGLKQGNSGSKQETISCTNVQNSPVLKVTPNVPNHFESNAVIENLIIDGTNTPGVVGISLEDVYNCVIRNVTIKNCAIGIEVKNNNYNFSFSNRFEHIRMINVKTGIQFTGTNNNKDFSYTTLDDVTISLKAAEPGSNDYVGIKIGPHAKLNNAYIKATVWLYTSGGKGMQIDSGGEIKYGLINFEVESPGTGLYISSGATVSNNQDFLLTSLGVTNDILNYGTCNGVITATA